ncbi:WAT1-related protein At1g43650-like [Henckelia pumila]|uniref:WAT1-related protein At1g43650-like n=1 Tax=Henckelia pumila TaxID=405737 RepID=UPI003C6DD0F6
MNMCTRLFLLAKLAISGSGMKPSVFVAYRQAFAFVTLAPFAFIFNKGSASITSQLPWHAHLQIFIISSYGLTLTMILTLVGLKYTSTTFATATLNIAPVLVYVMAVFCRIEKLAIREWHGVAKVLGTMFGFLGAMVFTFYKGPSLFSSSHHENHTSLENSTRTTKDWIKGSALLLAGEFTWSMWLTMQAPLLKQYPGNLRLAFLQTGYSCLSAIVYSASVERNISSWKLGWNVNFLIVAYCGIVVNGFVGWLQTWVIEKKGAVFSANFGPLAVVFAAIISIIFLKETLYVGSILGALLLAGGLYVFLWGTSKESKKESQQNLDPQKQEAQLDSIITSISPTHEDYNRQRKEDD